MDELRSQPMLKKMLWQVNIEARISQAYNYISDAILLFNVSNLATDLVPVCWKPIFMYQLGNKVDLRRFHEENEAARKADTKRSHENMRKVLENEHHIIEVTTCCPHLLFGFDAHP